MCIRLLQSTRPHRVTLRPLPPFRRAGPTERRGGSDPDSRPGDPAPGHRQAWTQLPPIPWDCSEPTLGSQNKSLLHILGFSQAPEARRHRVGPPLPVVFRAVGQSAHTWDQEMK